MRNGPEIRDETKRKQAILVSKGYRTGLYRAVFGNKGKAPITEMRGRLSHRNGADEPGLTHRSLIQQTAKYNSFILTYAYLALMISP
jgi:hypothetical protein